MRRIIVIFFTIMLMWVMALPVHASNAQPLPQLTIRFAPSPGIFPEGVSGVRTGVLGFRIDEFPEPIPPAGYTFIGWFSEGVQLEAPVASIRSMTILAGYAPVISGAAPSFAVMYDPGPGQLPQGTPPIQTFTYGSALVYLPQPTLEGYNFAGWQWEDYLVTAPHIIRGDMVLEAAWQAAPPTQALRPVPIPANQFVAAFNPYPGTFGEYETGIRFGSNGSPIEDLPGEPRRAGYVFTGWRMPEGPELTGPLTIRRDTILTAEWAPVQEDNPSAPIDTRPNPRTNPTTISFMIFGAVLILGAAAAGIYRLNKKQELAQGTYHAHITRTVREMKLLIRNRPR